MLQTTTRKIDVYEVEIADVEGKFKMSSELNLIDEDVLVPNPRYRELIKTHEHLQGIHMSDRDEIALDDGRYETSLPRKPTVIIQNCQPIIIWPREDSSH